MVRSRWDYFSSANLLGGDPPQGYGASATPPPRRTRVSKVLVGLPAYPAY